MNNNTYVVSLVALRRAGSGVETAHRLIDVVDCSSVAAAKKVAEEIFREQFPESSGWRGHDSIATGKVVLIEEDWSKAE